VIDRYKLKRLEQLFGRNNLSSPFNGHRDELLSKTMLQAIHVLMARSVPEIIKTLEQK
jgi:hypothetical protein